MRRNLPATFDDTLPNNHHEGANALLYVVRLASANGAVDLIASETSFADFQALCVNVFVLLPPPAALPACSPPAPDLPRRTSVCVPTMDVH
jgi:hypothetical protein